MFITKSWATIRLRPFCKINRFDYVKQKDFCSIDKYDNQVSIWEKIFAMIKNDKQLILYSTKTSCKLTRKRQET